MDDELLTAVAEALRGTGVTDPRAVLATADAALRVLGRDRCTHSKPLHLQYHVRPVRGCAWCHPGEVAKARRRRTVTVPVRDGLL